MPTLAIYLGAYGIGYVVTFALLILFADGQPLRVAAMSLFWPVVAVAAVGACLLDVFAPRNGRNRL